MKQKLELTISQGFLIRFKPPVDLHCFFEISIRAEKKFQLVYTEILSQFEMNAEMDISKKKQWRPTFNRGKVLLKVLLSLKHLILFCHTGLQW